MIEIKEDVYLRDYTTLGVGGPVAYFVEVATSEKMEEAVGRANAMRVSYLVIGSGSNLLVADAGWNGMIIKDSMEGIEIDGQKVKVLAGTLLQDLVDTANENGLAGLERMAGIPGTVGGAVYGNAGAYGQTISDHLIDVAVLDNGEKREFSKEECRFDYRESIFKKRRDLLILEVRLELESGDSGQLQKISTETIKKRLEKWKPEFRTPGSFFKNIIAAKLEKEILEKIPEDKIVYGKVPAGYLLEAVGARGATNNGIEIANYHANLFINTGSGTARDFYDLAMKYKDKVKEKFGIELEPEVQLVGFEQQ